MASWFKKIKTIKELTKPLDEQFPLVSYGDFFLPKNKISSSNKLI